MYIYGIIQHAWSLSILDMLVAFLMDIVLVRLLSLFPDIKIINETSDEEKQYFKEKADYFRKKWEVEELNRKILDKKLYG
jgi:hypothetical protein